MQLTEITCDADFLEDLFCIASDEDGTVVVGELDAETTDIRDLHNHGGKNNIESNVM